jgi:hypothetical protein
VKYHKVYSKTVRIMNEKVDMTQRILYHSISLIADYIILNFHFKQIIDLIVINFQKLTIFSLNFKLEIVVKQLLKLMNMLYIAFYVVIRRKH